MIRCSEYDYIEIVCMHRYPIRMLTKIGQVIDCIALDTLHNDDREECIKIKINELESYVVLNTIASLEVCIKNPHFEKIYFT